MREGSGRREMRRVVAHRCGDGNSMLGWFRVRNPLRVAVNFLVIYACRFLPSLWLKRVLLRMIGMRVGRNVAIGLGATFDIFFPELIEIGDNSVIGYNATLLAHEFLVGEWRTGRVRVGRDVMIGAMCLVLPGVEIGDGATVAAYSLVNRDVPPGALVGGVPARVLRGENEEV